MDLFIVWDKRINQVSEIELLAGYYENYSEHKKDLENLTKNLNGWFGGYEHNFIGRLYRTHNAEKNANRGLELSVDRWLYAARTWASELGNSWEQLLILNAKDLIVSFELDSSNSNHNYTIIVKEGDEEIKRTVDARVASEYLLYCEKLGKNK